MADFILGILFQNLYLMREVTPLSFPIQNRILVKNF